MLTFSILHAKRTCCDDEIIDCKEAYKRMLKERLNSYVVEVNKVKTMSNSSQRVVVIDLEKAQKFGLELHGFCCH